MIKHGLQPVIDAGSRILVLGSLPSDQSLQRGEYYGNPRNQFWTILSAVFDAPVPGSYGEKLALLHANGVALWDVIERAERPGSLDSAIRGEVPAAIPALLRDHPGIKRVLLNGGKAAALYRRHFAHLAVEHRALPSTSPIPGRNIKTLDEKIELWRAAILGS